MPQVVQVPNTTSTTPAEKKKRIVVNLPKETIQAEEGQPATRPAWARQLSDSGDDSSISVTPVQIITAEIYPPDAWRSELPDIIDVYLPGKVSFTIKTFVFH
jgi:hypothetical protein